MKRHRFWRERYAMSEEACRAETRRRQAFYKERRRAMANELSTFYKRAGGRTWRHFASPASEWERLKKIV